MKKLKKIAIGIGIFILVIVLLYVCLARRAAPESIQYGVSFNTLYARELGLEWQTVYDAIIDELGVRHFRLAAHWDLIEPEDDAWDFSVIDYQLDRADEVGASVIFSVGRRLPRWPECHVPEWAADLSWEDQKEELRVYITETVNRYKDRESILYWQVENEPFLSVFAHEHCGDLDVTFLDEEIELVRTLDPSRPILITDSGNLGTWSRPYKRGDAFGTSVYVYLWNPDIGPFRSFLRPSTYRVKTRLMELLYGKKETMLIELSLEPWLLQPIVETEKEIQLERMNISKFREIIDFAERTRFEKQYLWGAEWWYYMNERGYPDFWEEGKEIFSKTSIL